MHSDSEIYGTTQEIENKIQVTRQELVSLRVGSEEYLNTQHYLANLIRYADILTEAGRNYTEWLNGYTFDDGRTPEEVSVSSRIGQACVYLHWIGITQQRKTAYVNAFKVQGDFDQWCTERIHTLLNGLHDFLARAEDFVRYVDQQCIGSLQEMVLSGSAHDVGTMRIDS